MVTFWAVRALTALAALSTVRSAFICSCDGNVSASTILSCGYSMMNRRCE